MSDTPRTDAAWMLQGFRPGPISIDDQRYRESAALERENAALREIALRAGCSGCNRHYGSASCMDGQDGGCPLFPRRQVRKEIAALEAGKAGGK
jgi:hypothetical protein